MHGSKQASRDDYVVEAIQRAWELTARLRCLLELSRVRHKLSREEEKRRSTPDNGLQWRLFDAAFSQTADFIYLSDLNARLVYAN